MTRRNPRDGLDLRSGYDLRHVCHGSAMGRIGLYLALSERILGPNRIPFGCKSIGKGLVRSDFSLFNTNPKS